MQKARRHTALFESGISNLKFEISNSLPKGAVLRHLVSSGFQVLFHSLKKGSFRLSLAVLVHYRSPRSI